MSGTDQPDPPDEEGDREGIEVTDEEWAVLMEAAESVRQGKSVDTETVFAALARNRSA
jgi:hypothetical protein